MVTSLIFQLVTLFLSTSLPFTTLLLRLVQNPLPADITLNSIIFSLKVPVFKSLNVFFFNLLSSSLSSSGPFSSSSTLSFPIILLLVFFFFLCSTIFFFFFSHLSRWFLYQEFQDIPTRWRCTHPVSLLILCWFLCSTWLRTSHEQVLNKS